MTWCSPLHLSPSTPVYASLSSGRLRAALSAAEAHAQTHTINAGGTNKLKDIIMVTWHWLLLLALLCARNPHRFDLYEQHHPQWLLLNATLWDEYCRQSNVCSLCSFSKSVITKCAAKWTIKQQNNKYMGEKLACSVLAQTHVCLPIHLDALFWFILLEMYDGSFSCCQCL